MAELVVQANCKSTLRQATDLVLNVAFPLWGIVSPLVILFLLIQIVARCQASQQRQAIALLDWVVIWLSFSLTCILAKRALSNDVMIIDKQGLKIPRLIGMSFNMQTNIPWKSISNISSLVVDDDLNKSKLIIWKHKGKPFKLPLSKVSGEFIEQILLATEMWAPNIRDANLDQLQDLLRISAHESHHKSYTDLWEEELGRRFSPTAYIPLEPGRWLRNNTIELLSPLASGGLSALYLCQMNGKELVVLKEAVIRRYSL